VRRVALLVVLTLASGCAPKPWGLPRGTALQPPAAAATPLPVVGWVAHVAVEDRSLSPAFADSMTLSLRDYLQAARTFQDVALLGRPQADDVVLQLVVERYAHEEAYHSAYLPLFVATLRLYALLGGTRTIETQEMTARLELARGSGSPIGAVSASVSDRTTHTFYRAHEDPVDSAALRTRLVQDLLDRAMPLLRKEPGC
jgi:hypothetical protein